MGAWYGVGERPARGWQVLFSWNRNGTADHIETILEVYGDGTLLTIAGNVGNGDIEYMYRDLYYVMGYVRFDDSQNPYVPVPPPANYAAPTDPGLCWLVTSPYMSGEHIRWGQRFFNTCCSQSLDEDGIYGPLTRESVVNFQRFFSLLIDGVVGPETWNCMRYIAAVNGF
jgi:peptidoglycan hydrolase-like protein with peptidoglycan-binding domain